ncbi:hypothetical protein DLAC_04627 [Tieghemostelium lacteum]|uniref:RCC1-like domain-containing protein n=1 Tax=Tieghemostelium lacteum TaxID=361077 RepID=A0A151ZKB8_TIELA|nr:hypothetical protein DLAC_04627 [Tieghemostelium lacteum]|eukprot:KYQ94330.1 hypothetical protein DLAC_04627 [Tieghemostelium lacteum]
MINSVTNWLSCGTGAVDNWFFGEGEDEDESSSSNESDDSLDYEDYSSEEEEDDNDNDTDGEKKDQIKLRKNSKKKSSIGQQQIQEQTDQGIVYSWGYNYHGQCGNTKNQSVRLPTLIRFPGDGTTVIKSISCGESHTLALSEQYQVFSWGCNKWGQLGHNDKENRSQPKLLEIQTTAIIKDVNCGSQHSFLLTQFGEVFSFGCGTHGRLGHGDELPRYTPTPIPSLLGKQIAQLSGGLMHSAAVDNQGRVYTWGWNKYGQLGNGTLKKQMTPGKVKDLAQWHISKVSSGRNHTIALTSSGEMLAFGFNACGQLGIGSHTNSRVPTKIVLHDKVIDISCGYYHSLCLTENGEAYSWGYMSDGALGLGEVYGHQHRPQLIPLIHIRHSYTNSNDLFDEVYGSDNPETSNKDIESESVDDLLRKLNLSNANENPNPTVVNRHDHTNSNNIKTTFNQDKFNVGDTVDQITAGGWQSGIITSSGKLYLFGFGDNYRLGNNSEDDQDLPVLINGEKWGLEKIVNLENREYEISSNNNNNSNNNSNSNNSMDEYEFNQILQEHQKYQKKLSIKNKLFENIGQSSKQKQQQQQVQNSPTLESNKVKVYSRAVRLSLGSAHTIAIINNKLLRK